MSKLSALMTNIENRMKVYQIATLSAKCNIISEATTIDYFLPFSTHPLHEERNHTYTHELIFNPNLQARLEEHLDRAVRPFHLPEDHAGMPSNHFPPGTSLNKLNLSLYLDILSK